MTELDRGRYVLTDWIAQGGMGEVWRARDTALQRDVAVKLLRPAIAADAAFRTRFATEARNAASLHDPGIATVFDYGDETDPATGRHTTYLVMELVDGRPMSELLTAPLAPASAVHLVAQVARALDVAHRAGIVHRDVKPANFLVTRDGRVKITDFGIARARGAASVTDTGTIMGTPHYVAPEVAEGREATPASDIYALGVVLYECLAGTRPFTGETPIAVAMAHLRDDPPTLPETVSTPLRALVASALSKDPAQRPPTAAAFADALRRGLPHGAAPHPADDQRQAAGLPPGTRLLELGVPAPAPGRRLRPAWVPIVAASIAVLLVAAVAIATLGSGADSADQTGGTSRQPGEQSPSSDTPTSTPTLPPTSAESTATPTGVTIEPADYIGLDRNDAKQALEGLGLRAREEKVPGGEKHRVADVAPTGVLPLQSEVTLFVYDGKDQGDDDDEGGED